MRIAINGAGIAGTALAFWLGRLGHEVLLLESAPALRAGGFVVNLWGIGYDALERMGLLGGLLERQHWSSELRMVDRHGRTRGGYPSSVLMALAKGRLAALARTDIAEAIFEGLDPRVEVRFGDSVREVDDDGQRVRLKFERSAPEAVDLLVGADGLHSQVRRIVFGPEADFEHRLGCHVASFEAKDYPHRDGDAYLAYTAPGRYLARFPLRDGRTLFFVLLRDRYLGPRPPTGAEERKAALRAALSGVGWESQDMLAALDRVPDPYFDSISQIRMPAWYRGRVGLIGDAASCPSLIAGEGAGFALAQAYVLAGELHRCGGAPERAFQACQALLKPSLDRRQRQAEGLVGSFVPRTAPGVYLRDHATRLMRVPALSRLLMGRYFHDDVRLPDYGM